MLASLDGAIGPAAETRIPVNDEGLTRGDGGFEVARLYGGRPFAMDDHYARLRPHLQRACASTLDLTRRCARRSTRCSPRRGRSRRCCGSC